MADATPRPWKIIQTGPFLGLVPVKRPKGVPARDVEDVAELNLDDEQHDTRANATLIVRAVNQHDDLLTACKEMRGYLKARVATLSDDEIAMLQRADTVIAHAEAPAD